MLQEHEAFANAVSLDSQCSQSTSKQFYICVCAGVYKIYDHGRDSRLAYELEVPQEPSDVQEDFRIKKTGSYIISVKVSNAVSS